MRTWTERAWAVMQLLAAVAGGCITVTVAFGDRPTPMPAAAAVVAPPPPTWAPAPCTEPPRTPLNGCGGRR